VITLAAHLHAAFLHAVLGLIERSNDRTSNPSGLAATLLQH
jgi:hypothetical protein